MDTAQWPQGIGDEVKAAAQEKKPRPQKEQALNCPRCNSTNTKFCYYNNYSLSQPRYYCKTCRRYWTQGGSLRNIPVGGASRRNKKQQSSSSSSSPATISASRKVLTTPPNFSTPNPNKFQQGQDLNLAYNPFGNLPALPIFGNKSFNPNHHLPIMELFKNNGDHMGSSSYMVAGPGSDPGFGSGFRVHDDEDRYKAGLGNFSSNDQNNGYGNLQGDDHASNNNDPSSSSRMLFPFEELKGVSNNEQFDHHQDWNGMLAGGSW